jgi:hypothetical protein
MKMGDGAQVKAKVKVKENKKNIFPLIFSSSHLLIILGKPGTVVAFLKIFLIFIEQYGVWS